MEFVPTSLPELFKPSRASKNLRKPQIQRASAGGEVHTAFDKESESKIEKLEILKPDPEIEEIAPASGREIAPGAEGMSADVNIPCMAWGCVDTGLRGVLGKAFGCPEVSGEFAGLEIVQLIRVSGGSKKGIRVSRVFLTSPPTPRTYIHRYS